ncbi:hypothetical protein ACQ4LE_003136 [Meloidogyne hapla]|uniref:Uncharacterized protein n=1 Tax=Meloidogyne hapla TaxID=6305 RepID=A0A1I8B8B1_MELHA
MKRYDNESAGNFIIPKMPKINDNNTMKVNVTTNFSSSNGVQNKPTLASSSRHPRLSSIWTGSLRFGEQIVESIDLYPPIRECSKPSGFSSCLEMQQLIKSKDFINYWPIQELIKELSRNNNNQSPLLKKRSIIICSSSEQKTTTPVRISYLFLINTFSPLFARICKEMMEKELIAFGLLNDYSILYLFPNGYLSTKLDIPTRDGPMLHCLFISDFKELKSKFELYNFDNIPLNPSSIDKFDGTDPKIISEFKYYHKRSHLPINSKLSQPKQLESIFTPNQRPPGGKPVTPYIPTPGYPQPRFPKHQRFPSASPNFNTNRPSMTKQFFTGNQQQFLPYGPSFSDSNFISFPPPPPPPPPESEDISPPIISSSAERRQKNKAMIANAFEQIRSIGKTTLNSEGTSSKISQPLFEQQQTDNLIRDPRLSRRINELIQPPPPPPPVSPEDMSGNLNGEMKTAKIDEEKVIIIKKEPSEVLHETVPMDISGGGDTLSMSLQMYISSPEPMEEDEQTNIEKSSEENKIISDEEKKIKKEKESIDNISGIAGGEMPMDLCLNSD